MGSLQETARPRSLLGTAAVSTLIQQDFRMKLSALSLTICLICLASTTATLFNTLRSPGQKTKIPKEAKPPKDVSYLSLNPAPAPESVRLPIGELPLYKQRHLYSSYRIPTSGVQTQSTAYLRSVGSTFSKNAFALEKDTFYPDKEPHVSKNTFVQNPGPLPEVQPLVSAPAKPNHEGGGCHEAPTSSGGRAPSKVL